MVLEVGQKVKWAASGFQMEGAVMRVNDDGTVLVKTHYRNNAVYVANVIIQEPKILTT